MRKVEGNADVRLLECVSPARNKWRIRWDVQVHDDNQASFMEAEFNHRPSDEEIRSTVLSWFNTQTEAEILSGFVWNGFQVWLSTENQFNYKAAYDLAVQTSGATLPVTFKFGTDAEPVYHAFSSLNELTSFYTAAMQHIQSALSKGWKRKDAFDLADYQV